MRKGPLFLLFSLQVPDILGTIFIRMPTVQERSLRGFLLEGVGILAGFHPDAVTTSLLAKPLPMDRYLPLPTSCAWWRTHIPQPGKAHRVSSQLQILWDELVRVTVLVHLGRKCQACA